MNKRGNQVLYGILHLLAAVAAALLIISVMVKWSTGGVINRYYYSKDLALLTDTLFIADGTTHFLYRDNLSKYDVDFSNYTVFLKEERLDPTSLEFSFVREEGYDLENEFRNPNRLFFVKTPKKLIIAEEEQEYKKDIYYEDIEIKDRKEVVVSPKTESLEVFSRDMASSLKRAIPDFQLSYSKEAVETAPVQLIIGEAADGGDVNIVYIESSNEEITKKRAKLANKIHNSLFSDGVKAYIMQSNLKITQTDNTAILIELGRDWVEDPSKIVAGVSNGLEEHYEKDDK